MEQERLALEYITKSIQVDLCPPNQLGIPIALDNKIMYISSAINILNKVLEDLKKNKEEYDTY